MQYDTAKQKLMEEYRQLGYEIQSVLDQDGFVILIDYGSYHGDEERMVASWRYPSEKIQNYSKNITYIEKNDIYPLPLKLVTSKHREDLIEHLGPRRTSSVTFTKREDKSDEKIAAKSIIQKFKDGVSVILGSASELFVDYYRFDKDFIKLFGIDLERAKPDRISHKDLEYVEDFDYLPPLTVRVEGLHESSGEAAYDISSKYIDSFLFSLSYQSDLLIMPTDSWSKVEKADSICPKSSYFFEKDIVEEHYLRSVNAFYKPIPLRYYWLARSTPISVLKFLSYYQVMEYFFVEAADEKLYSRLKELLVDPSFTISPSNLDRIILSVENHRRETDETEMLKLVLRKYLDESELIDFVSELDTRLGEKYYSKQRDLFGQKLQVDLREGHIFGGVSKTIKTIRNALVHASDRYERAERYVPFTESTKIVEKEIELMRYIAERVIISTAESVK